MTITKQNIIDFLESFFEKESYYVIQDRDPKLANSLSEVGAILDTYWLFGKPRDYILTEKDVREIMYMSQPDTHAYTWFKYKKGEYIGGVDLYDYYIKWNIIDMRDDLINSVVV